MKMEIAIARCLVVVALGTLCTLIIVGCGDDDGGVCPPGSTQACLCPEGGSGVQTCQSDGGSWGQCQGCSSCSCDTGAGCQTGCSCDPDCSSTCSCDTSSSCQAGCSCDPDCTTCTPNCFSRECGPDPVCGESCGSCGAYTECLMDCGEIMSPCGDCSKRCTDALSHLVVCWDSNGFPDSSCESQQLDWVTPSSSGTLQALISCARANCSWTSSASEFQQSCWAGTTPKVCTPHYCDCRVESGEIPGSICN